MTTISLGDVVKDKVTGLKGTVMARTEWLNGCVRINIQPKAFKDGVPVDTVTIDETQLDILTPYNKPNKTTGGGGGRRDDLAQRR